MVAFAIERVSGNRYLFLGLHFSFLFEMLALSYRPLKANATVDEDLDDSLNVTDDSAVVALTDDLQHGKMRHTTVKAAMP